MNEYRQRVRALLDGLSDLEVRESCITALRQWHAQYPDRPQFSLHGELGREVLPLLAQRKATALDEEQARVLSNVFIDPMAMNEPWMMSVFEFLNWFVRAGLAWPLGAPVNTFPITLRLTKMGVRLLSLREENHALLTGFVARIAGRCAGLPDDVQSLLSDAQACLDHGLMRPSIALMGVAYEATVEHVIDALVARNVLAAAAQNHRAAAAINAVRGVLNNVFPNNIDDRTAAAQALDFADHLRRRRNDASHTTPTYGFEDRAEVEERIRSTKRVPGISRDRASAA